MRIAVFGSTGGTGRLLVERALDAGHDVTAVARNPAKVTLAHDRLRVVPGDVLDLPSVEAAAAGADAVMSAVGLRSRKSPPACGPGMTNLIKAMQAAGVRRFVGISAAPVGRRDEGDRLLYRLTVLRVLRALLKAPYADLAEMEEKAGRSDLEWTIFRPPALSDKPPTGRYRIAIGRNIPGGYTITRSDLAAAMLESLEQPATVGATVGISNTKR